VRVRLPKGRLARLSQRAIVAISPVQILVAAGVLFGADAIYDRLGDTLTGGVFDELAHASTALLCLNLLPARARRRILLPALIAAVLIDADHIPQYLFHSFILTVGTPRPYTHSLLTLLLCLTAAAAAQRHGRVWLGVAVGVALHFLRDMAEGSGTGIALFWPLSDRGYGYPHGVYLALMGAVTLANLELWRRRSRARAQGRSVAPAGAEMPTSFQAEKVSSPCPSPVVGLAPHGGAAPG
jgi:inner membrane protein